MLYNQKRKGLLRLIQAYRVEIIDTEMENGTCHELDIGRIWALPDCGSFFDSREPWDKEESWIYDYNNYKYLIKIIGPELALIDDDGGCDSAWEIMIEIAEKFFALHQSLLDDPDSIKQAYQQFIHTMAELDEGFVYFLKKQGHENLYKIGRSKKYPARISKLEVKLPFDVEPHLIYCSSKHKYSEKLLHSFYSNMRVRGEWFSLCADDLALLEIPAFCQNMLLDKVIIGDGKLSSQHAI